MPYLRGMGGKDAGLVILDMNSVCNMKSMGTVHRYATLFDIVSHQGMG